MFIFQRDKKQEVELDEKVINLVSNALEGAEKRGIDSKKFKRNLSDELKKHMVQKISSVFNEVLTEPQKHDDDFIVKNKDLLKPFLEDILFEQGHAANLNIKKGMNFSKVGTYTVPRKTLEKNLDTIKIANNLLVQNHGQQIKDYEDLKKAVNSISIIKNANNYRKQTSSYFDSLSDLPSGSISDDLIGPAVLNDYEATDFTAVDINDLNEIYQTAEVTKDWFTQQLSQGAKLNTNFLKGFSSNTNAAMNNIIHEAKQGASVMPNIKMPSLPNAPSIKLPSIDLANSIENLGNAVNGAISMAGQVISVAGEIFNGL